MQLRPEIHVSVDVGYQHHSVAIGLSDGTLLEEFDIAHRPEGFDDFFQRIESRQCQHGGGVTVAMEGYNGYARPLDRLVQERDYRLLNINNLKLARFKEIFPAAAKNDRIDARRGLELMQLGQVLPIAREALQVVAAAPRVNDQLKRLTRRRRSLVNEKTRILSRFQTDLQAVCPGLLEITASADNLWFLNFISHAVELPKLARLHSGTLLKIPAIGKAYAEKIRQWQKRAVFSNEVEWVGAMIVEDARRILELHKTVDTLTQQCQTLISQSNIATSIDSVPGFGVTCASELAGEIGTIDRFRNERGLALYLGMAALDNSSGKFKGSKQPKHVNTRAKAAMMTGVDRHRKQVPESQRYYEKKRAEGKTHNQSIRALGRHLCRVLYKMLSENRLYESRE